MVSAQYTGTAMGTIVPRPKLLISPRTFTLFREHEIRGIDTSVAYFDPM